MDLQKEREAFEKECRLLCYKGNMVMSNLGSFYNNEQTNWMWQMWLSAQAQAVPDGYCVVPKEPTPKMSIAYQKNAIAPVSSLSISGYKAMIEAQEPAND